MALVECPDCSKQVSSNAPACPNCGAPIAGALAESPPATPSAPEVQTVEQTSKKYKGQQALGCVVALVSGVGVCTAATNEDTELGAKFMLGALFGLIWFIGARAFAWWNHG
jgi:hypothetical protein